MEEARGILSKNRVIAGSFIPHGSWYGPVQKIDFIKDEIKRELDEFNIGIKIITDMGMLKSETNSEKPWYHYLQPARDIHEQNLNIFRSRDGNLYLRATRDIETREVIFCWYDECLARELNVPYLAPANILGIGKYCCTKCKQEFSFPNPLKLHIMHNCSEFKNLKTLDNVSESTKNLPFSMTTSPPFNNSFLAENSYHSNKLYRSDKQRDFEGLHHDNTSRYKELEPCVTRYTLKASFEFVPNVTSYAVREDRNQYKTERSHFDNGIFINGSQYKKLQHVDTDEEEPIEVLRKSCSIMTSDKGHLCVFCGKLYSRKYGLKIHLRTHTGYKPLKCKICLRAFGDPSNLNKHIRLHAQGNTPYQCTYCGKVLVRRRDLVRHLKSRHPNEVLS